MDTDTEANSVFDEAFWLKFKEDVVEKEDRRQLLGTRSHVLKSFYEKSLIPSNNVLTACLYSKYAQKDLTKAFELTRFFQLCGQGHFVGNSGVCKDSLKSKIELCGAENWGKVMCYLDSLLFAMYARLTNFEPLLLAGNKDDSQKLAKLRALLRLYVSLLRSGNLITQDITKLLCESLFENGFKEAMSRKQEDCCEFFIFLTEVLQMPLLTLKIDIAHGGAQGDKDDHRFTKERMLYVSIPDSSSEDEPVLLEECLEHYFNNSIQVKRQLGRLSRRGTMESGHTRPVAVGQVVDVPEMVHEHFETGDDDDEDEEEEEFKAIKQMPSQLGSVTLENTGYSNESSDTVTASGKFGGSGVSSTFGSSEKDNYTVTVRTRANSLASMFSENKSGEVSLPAWMFLQLLPFYTDLEPKSVTEQSFAAKRPILPICLKRYTFGAGGKKNNRKVIIPSIIELPSFIAEESESSDNRFRLVLESVVCHRGSSINSGHFVALVRDEVAEIELNDEKENEKRWLLFDDLNDKRVTDISFKDAMNQETPYILFYRMEPISWKTDQPEKLSTIPSVMAAGTAKSDHTLTSGAQYLSIHFDASTLPKGKSEPSVAFSDMSINSSEFPELHSEEIAIDGNTNANINSGKKNTSKRSHDILTKVALAHSTEPYPNSLDYRDISEKFYWRLKMENGYFEESPIPDATATGLSTKRNSVVSESDSVRSIYSTESNSSRVHSRMSGWKQDTGGETGIVAEKTRTAELIKRKKEKYKSEKCVIC